MSDLFLHFICNRIIFFQLAAAVENLKHIFNVPETVKRTKDYIEDGKLLHAHKWLINIYT